MKNSMIKKLAVLLLVLCFTTFSSADEATTKVTALSGAGETSGNLSDGAKMDLRWAEQSNVAAFPGTRFEMFNGNHNLYRVTLPAGAKIDITLTPESGKLINLYALRLGVDDQSVPPDIARAISAEARYPIYANLTSGKRVTNPDDGIRKIDFISVSSPYTILIGVAGAQGLTEGDYKLKVDISAR